MTRATISLPTPLSPVINTLASQRAAQSASSRTFRVALLAPIITDGAMESVPLKMLEGLRTSQRIFTSVTPKVNRQNATKTACKRHQQTSGLPYALVVL